MIKIDFNKTCCFTGHRPEKLMGTEDYIRSRLAEEIWNAINDGYTTFITGMAPGVDTWAAQEVMRQKAANSDIKMICAVPFKGVEKKRTQEEQALFNTILNAADMVEYICTKYQHWAFQARDRWMVDHAARVIAVFNGTHGGTAITINIAKEKERDIVMIEDGENV